MLFLNSLNSWKIRRNLIKLIKNSAIELLRVVLDLPEPFLFMLKNGRNFLFILSQLLLQCIDKSLVVLLDGGSGINMVVAVTAGDALFASGDDGADLLLFG